MRLCFLATSERGACARASTSSESDQSRSSESDQLNDWSDKRYLLMYAYNLAAEASAEQANLCRMRTPPSKSIQRQRTQGTVRNGRYSCFICHGQQTTQPATSYRDSEPPGLNAPAPTTSHVAERCQGARHSVFSSSDERACGPAASRKRKEWCNRHVYDEGRFSCLTSRRNGLPQGTSHVCTSLKYLSASSGGHGGEQKDGAFHADGIVVVGPVRGVGDRRLRRQLESFYDAADFVHVGQHGRRMRGSSAAA